MLAIWFYQWDWGQPAVQPTQTSSGGWYVSRYLDHWWYPKKKKLPDAVILKGPADYRYIGRIEPLADNIRVQLASYSEALRLFDAEVKRKTEQRRIAERRENDEILILFASDD
jgi:hypothetical protein